MRRARRRRLLASATTLLLLALAATAGVGADARAQGVTTAAITGAVGVEGGDEYAAEGAEVRVINRTTGVATRAVVRRGRFAALGLEVGGPYSVVIRRVGFRVQARDDLYLSLGQSLYVAFRLERVATRLDTMRVVADRPTAATAFSRSRTGVGAVVSDSALRRLPTANRDLYDFVQLAPEVSTRVGVSGGGVSYRFNSFLIDGTSERTLQGNGPAGVKTISIEAVKEYQVLLSPYDVRYGDFAGALVNAVTKSGTNDVRGSAFVYARNEKLARNVAALRDSPYDRAQFGFSFGGPLVRDRVHFFVTSELQRLSSPAGGPYVGQSDSAETPLPVRTADIERFRDVLRTRYRLDGGSAGPVSNRNPLVNLFARLDVALPAWNSRFVLRHNYHRSDRDDFSRPTREAVFPLTSSGLTQEVSKQAVAAALYSNLRGGGFNELTAGLTSVPLTFVPNERAPLVYVAVPDARDTGATAFIQAGSSESAHGGSLQQRTLELADNLTLPGGRAHRLTVGARVDRYHMSRDAVFGSYGVWGFSSLDSLARGEADSFRVAKSFGAAEAPLRGVQPSAYVADQWQASDRLTLTLGLRADASLIRSRPPYVAAVDALFHRRTDAIPSGTVQWSPRVGFNWDVHGDARDQLRGGAGLFVGRPPLGWWFNAIQNYGTGIRTLTCGGGPTDRGRPPPFVADYRTQPHACANGGGFDGTQGGSVSLLDPHLEMAQAFKASLAYDRQLPWDVVASVEGLFTKGVKDFVFVNLNLKGPAGVDRHGRVMYGAVDADGVATPDLVAPQFTDVIDLRNQSRNYSYEVTTHLEKRFSNRFEGAAAYTFSRARDVQSALDPLAYDNWQYGRAVSGRHDALDLGVSDFDQPHRVVLVGTYTAAPWRGWRTDVSMYYVGSSGGPFTYVAAGNPGTGDLNADGTSVNDPIYVPKNAYDPNEIRFAGDAQSVVAQQAALERFIRGTPCLNSQRGRIMARNSCRGPWLQTMNASLRQSLRAARGHALAVELQVFDLPNLLNPRWGAYRVPSRPLGQPAVSISDASALLTQVGQTAGRPSESQPIFRFASRPRYNTQSPRSYYQLQLGTRYSF